MLFCCFCVGKMYGKDHLILNLSVTIGDMDFSGYGGVFLCIKTGFVKIKSIIIS